MATSAVDATFPADVGKVSKATMRSQFLTIKNELTSLLTRTGVAGHDAFLAPAKQPTVKVDRLPRLLAFGVVSFTVANN